MGGQLGITVEGIDVLGNKELALPADRLLSDSSLETSTEDESSGRQLKGDGGSGESHQGPHPEGPSFLAPYSSPTK